MLCCKVISRKYTLLLKALHTKAIFWSATIVLIGGLISPLYTYAQSSADSTSAESHPAPETALPVAPLAKSETVFPRHKYPSVLFTYWEHSALEDSRKARGHVRPPTEIELKKDLKKPSAPEAPKIKPPPEERELYLSGIVYHSPKNWSIWFNGKYITPSALPKEILELNVHKTYIELKWFDDYSNQIFPIRLRPHQRFNIDTRIFLPG